MNLGYKIKKIRYQYNLSQDELAKMLDINRNYLSRIETNKSLPTADILIKLSSLFSISIDKFLDISLENDTSLIIKQEKIKKIYNYCLSLNNYELDFIIKLLSTMINSSR